MFDVDDVLFFFSCIGFFFVFVEVVCIVGMMCV